MGTLGRHRRRSARAVLCWSVVGVLVTACAGGTTSSTTGTTVSSSGPVGSGPGAGTTAAPSFTTSMVDVNGSRVAVTCAGEGPKTVVFVSGLGETGASSWAASGVPASTTGTSKVCTYDRPGLGSSGPASTPRTVPAQVAELAALVQRGALPAPLVLVAQGYGNFIARSYAKEHLKDVAGLVLVDPPLGALDPTPPPDATAGQLAEHEGIADLNANLGAYGAGALPPPPVPTIVLGVGDAPDLPPTVPTGGPTTTSPSGTPSPTMPVAERREQQQLLARRSPYGSYELIPDTGTYLQYWRPEAVVAAIRTVLDDPRAPRPTPA